jgi:hypothetical protein
MVARVNALRAFIGESSSSIILIQGTNQAYADNKRKINYPKVLLIEYLLPIQTEREHVTHSVSIEC